MDVPSKTGGASVVTIAAHPTAAQQQQQLQLGAVATATGARRTKKRPSYGMRTVELVRGQLGFGFTLSGQGPCILSNIVAESPAARAMLRAGDHVIAVNGRNVSKLGHDEVVKLIGNSTGLLKLQIAESYCSNSSSEDEVELASGPRTAQVVVHRHHHHQPQPHSQRPHFQPNQPPQYDHHDEIELAARGYLSDDEEYTMSPKAGGVPPPLLPRPFHMRGNSADSTLTESSALHTAAYQRPRRPSPRKRANKPTTTTMKTLSPSKSSSNLKRIELQDSEELQLTEHDAQLFVHHPALHELRRSVKQANTAKLEADLNQAVMKAVVGYLGTIEMPMTDAAPTSLTAIRNCIRRLRVEKKVHTLVLMAILPEKTVLINHHGFKLAEYPSDRITFCGMYMDDKRFFGLVTSQQLMQTDEEEEEAQPASSCHVFMTEPNVDKEEMIRRGRAFQFEPTPSTLSPNDFLEFPNDARPIIQTIMAVYGKDQDGPPNPVAEPARAMSSASSSSEARSATASSSTNSDSGIGYRDDPDAILLMEPHSPPLPEQLKEIEENEANEARERFDVRVMPVPKDVSVADLGNPEPLSCGNPDESFNSELLDSQHSAASLRQSMQKYLQSKQEHLKKSSQNLLDIRNGPAIKPRLVTPTSSSASSIRDGGHRASAAALDNRPLFLHPSGFTRASSARSSVRSLEEIRFDQPNDFSTPAVKPGSDLNARARLPATSSLLDASSPLARYLYSSETNLSQLTNTESSQPPLLSLMPGRGILRPCDQYPSEPGVLTSRPVSVQSSYGGGAGGGLGGCSTASRNGDDFETEDKGGSQRGDTTATDDVDAEVSSQAGSVAGSERGIDIGRVGSWATDFEKLLADPVGLRTFAEFLKKEFSHENIYFWTACERYRRLSSRAETTYEQRRHLADTIIRRHLASGAPEQVNVDSHARQAAIEGIENASSNLFSTAQKQIYNLMKFDSFSRFLKSDLYKEALTAEMNGKPIKLGSSELDPDIDIGLDSVSENQHKMSLGRKSKSETNTKAATAASASNESNRRRSLLPSWNNLRGGSSKDRSKSKDRASDFGLSKKSEPVKRNDLEGGSQSSSTLNTSNESEDGANGNGAKLARVILPDKATTVVQTRHGETIRAMVARLLEKRALKFTSFDVFTTENAERPLDLAEDSTSIAATEVRVEPRVLFRLELPSKKSIGVKAKPAKLVKDVLGPILSQYGWSLDMMVVRRETDSTVSTVDMTNTVASIDNCRLVVSPRSSADINARVLEDLLRVKSAVDKMAPPHDVDDVDRRSTKSESSNGSTSRKFFRHSSAGILLQATSSNLPQEVDEKLVMPPPGMIPQARRVPQPPTKQPSTKQLQQLPSPVTEELYESFKIVQRGRLEDQRGTEINFEMPEFLKRGINKENHGPPPYGHHRQQQQPQAGGVTRQSEPVFRRDIFPNFSSGHPDRHSTQSHRQPQSFDYAMLRPSQDFPASLNESNFSNEGFLPSLQDADRYFGVTTPQAELGPMDSRLSFGMRSLPPMQQQQLFPGTHFPDPIYETLSYHHRTSNAPLPPQQQHRWSSTASTVSAPNLPSSGMSLPGGHKRDPPPLPPKPRLMSMKSEPAPPSAFGLPPNFTAADLVGLTRTDERGYSVSFV